MRAQDADISIIRQCAHAAAPPPEYGGAEEIEEN